MECGRCEESAVPDYRRISFDSAEVVPGINANTWFLTVRGTKPWITMRVELSPLIYIQRPDYWGIEVIGIQSGIGLPAAALYVITIEISHVLGKKGVEVIGATKSEKIDVPPK